jgi:hypothetical protein
MDANWLIFIRDPGRCPGSRMVWACLRAGLLAHSSLKFFYLFEIIRKIFNVATFGMAIANYMNLRAILSSGKETISMILLYAEQNDRVVETLQKLLAGLKTERFRSVASIAKRLSRPCHGLEIALVVIREEDEMIRIAEIENLIRGLRLVVVLPGHDPEMVSMAHKLGPRFIAYADNGFEQAVAVIRKMAGTSKRVVCA